MSTADEQAYPDGSKYEGQRNSKNEKHGVGKFDASGFVYEGEFHKGFSHGHGLLDCKHDKFKYSGDFENGKMHGFGRLEINGIVYEGEFRDGKLSGHGRVRFQDGTHGIPIYEGRFENNKFSKAEACQSAVQKAVESSTKAQSITTS